MNHLAHLFLSQNDLHLLIGNFIADHVKGKQIERFSPEIRKGIEMHRAIDTFTDRHPFVIKSKERLYSKYHKYAPVIVDMFYDHILAKNWKDYSPISLKKFAEVTYQLLHIHEANFPERSKLMLHYMHKQDWLSNYATFEGIEKALKGLSNRARFDSKMDQSVFELKRDYSLYETEFKPFFKDLFEYCAAWQKTAK